MSKCQNVKTLYFTDIFIKKDISYAFFTPCLKTSKRQNVKTENLIFNTPLPQNVKMSKCQNTKSDILYPSLKISKCQHVKTEQTFEILTKFSVLMFRHKRLAVAKRGQLIKIALP